MLSAFFSFLHFVAVFGIVAVVALQWSTLTAAPTHREARLLQRSDRWYGILAGAVLAAGFVRVFYLEKGSAYYFGNPFFVAKLGLFIGVGLLSIYPTVRLIRWRAQMTGDAAPAVGPDEVRRMRTILGVELVLLLLMTLCAAMMARGVTF